ncbi:hypothetical protein LZ575_17750 [Antarcticibacterium sp. 1MA-6-2]|uniref:hypothetical protein n=1 Tax=Antarcticibacterium sp. 1MA-6-2 TaxID=2908210 RepID=UPI001F1B3096|nr:hypothetical protein [Antarcticibacterium sp. 1MA-6-2]UJH90606.1 hypothetical protein LZ575_17750 [Antarcticibacterium sp. 1MA-6-2]
MIRCIFFFISVLGIFGNGFSQDKVKEITWPGGQKIAVSLSYDDGLNSQLDNVVLSTGKV